MWRLNEATGEQNATFLTGRQCREILIRWQAHLLKQALDAIVAFPVVVFFVATAFAFDNGAHRTREAGRNFLFQRRKHRARLAKYLALVRFEFARDYFHERGLARTITSNQTNPLAAVDLKIDAIQQRCTAEAQADIEKTHNSHKNPPTCPSASTRARLAFQPVRFYLRTPPILK